MGDAGIVDEIVEALGAESGQRFADAGGKGVEAGGFPDIELQRHGPAAQPGYLRDHGIGLRPGGVIGEDRIHPAPGKADNGVLRPKAAAAAGDDRYPGCGHCGLPGPSSQR